MISPSATSPALSDVEDNGLFFRTAPSDARSAEVLAEILHEKGDKSIAITYVNNDYGKGLADGIEANFVAGGGSVTINAGHEESKADYSSDAASLAQAGGDILVVAGYEFSVYADTGYDAAALIMLAMQAGNSSSSSELKNHVMDVANAPGEKIYPGEITKGLKILADGGFGRGGGFGGFGGGGGFCWRSSCVCRCGGHRRC